MASNSAARVLALKGTLRLCKELNTQGFGPWVRANAAVLRRYFAVDLFEGSLNVDPGPAPLLRDDLDAGRPPPTFVIPHGILKHMAPGLGNGQAWECELIGDKFARPVWCWIFRRIRSRVPASVVEIVAREGLVDAYQLRHGDKVRIDILSR